MGRPGDGAPGRPAYAQPLSPSRQVPGSMAFVTDSNRPQPLRQPPPTASITAAGAASQAPSLPMHPWGCPLKNGGGGAAPNACRQRPAPFFGGNKSKPNATRSLMTAVAAPWPRDGPHRVGVPAAPSAPALEGVPHWAARRGHYGEDWGRGWVGDVGATNGPETLVLQESSRFPTRNILLKGQGRGWTGMC